MTRQLDFIHGTKAHLRPLRADDHYRIRQIASQKIVSQNTSAIPHPYPDGQAQIFVGRILDETKPMWALDASHVGHSDLIGLIGLSMPADDYELGYVLDPAFWGLGYMSAAVKDLIAQNPLNVASVNAGVFQDNPASARVLTKAGFAYTGDDEAFSIARNAIVQRWRYIYTYAQ